MGEIDRLFRCLDDVDDEVRDRAAMYLRSMREPDLAETYLKDGEYQAVLYLSTKLTDDTSGPIYSLSALETKLVAYIKDTESYAAPFDVTSIPRVSRSSAAAEVARPSSLDTVNAVSTSSNARVSASVPAAPSTAEAQNKYAEQLSGVPEFEGYGALVHSSTKVSMLTESETEYVVGCVKHVFKEHVVFQVSYFSLRLYEAEEGTDAFIF